MKSVLTYYGFKGGNFSASAKPVNKLDFDAELQFGGIEKKSNIDTKEEFLTAAYFTPVDVKPSAKARIEQHLPKTRAGVLKLCNLWKLKMAEKPWMIEKYAAAIRLVRKLASEKMGINVSHDEVEAHYARSIDNKLSGLYATIRNLNKEEQDETIELTRNYLLDPSESNRDALISYKETYANNSNKIEAFYNMLSTISKNLSVVI